jgi:hypothetical protein
MALDNHVEHLALALSNLYGKLRWWRRGLVKPDVTPHSVRAPGKEQARSYS